MKSIVKNLTTAALSLAALALSIPQLPAADLRLEGDGFYSVDDEEEYFTKGPRQTGRYRTLGRDYYHYTEISIDAISNLSKSRSGSISFEFWAMPYYGATSGIVLLTRGIEPLRGRRSFEAVDAVGDAVSLGAKRFPELSLWEYTRRNGWINRDHLTFEFKEYL